MEKSHFYCRFSDNHLKTYISYPHILFFAYLLLKYKKRNYKIDCRVTNFIRTEKIIGEDAEWKMIAFFAKL
ncbi:hypothetical protein BuS5_02217 [Desulfosarcina sp. BuS5]|nr:hypothetical protein BuS5_02217 [Desulfosarcina sp. BuS5]